MAPPASCYRFTTAGLDTLNFPKETHENDSPRGSKAPGSGTANPGAVQPGRVLPRGRERERARASGTRYRDAVFLSGGVGIRIDRCRGAGETAPACHDVTERGTVCPSSHR
jgi:hypothetical protein